MGGMLGLAKTSCTGAVFMLQMQHPLYWTGVGGSEFGFKETVPLLLKRRFHRWVAKPMRSNILDLPITLEIWLPSVCSR